MIDFHNIRTMLRQGRCDEVLTLTDSALHNGDADNEHLWRIYYERGNAYRQRGDLGMAMNNYLEAINLNPDSPAAEAYRSLQEVMRFYDKDRYNP